MSDKKAKHDKLAKEQAKEFEDIKASFRQIKDSQAMQYLVDYLEESEKRLVRIAQNRVATDKEGNSMSIDSQEDTVFIQRSAMCRELLDTIERLSKNV